MTPFEDYAEQSNLAHEIYGKRETGFGAWLVDNMPKTEREVAAMRKAWEAGGFFAIETVERFLYEQEDNAGKEIAALKRLRDDLHETTNRYLERARKAESRLLELKPTGIPALYLQQIGRILRPDYKPPSRWQRFKFWVEDVCEWLGDFPR
jgi:hypothetical protein